MLTTARMPDGTEVAGKAWFRVSESDQRIDWGSEGPNDYSGYLDVTPAGDTSSKVEVNIHTSRVEDQDEQILDGLRETLDSIKQQAEGA